MMKSANLTFRMSMFGERHQRAPDRATTTENGQERERELHKLAAAENV